MEMIGSIFITLVFNFIEKKVPLPTTPMSAAVFSIGKIISCVQIEESFFVNLTLIKNNMENMN